MHFIVALFATILLLHLDTRPRSPRCRFELRKNLDAGIIAGPLIEKYISTSVVQEIPVETIRSRIDDFAANRARPAWKDTWLDIEDRSTCT